jgi:phage-related protein
MGGVDLAAKPLQGFGGAGVVEIVASFRSDTYRAIYTASGWPMHAPTMHRARRR